MSILGVLALVAVLLLLALWARHDVFAGRPTRRWFD